MEATPLTLTGAAAMLREGATTSIELTERALAGADQLDPKLGVYLARFDEYSLRRAAAADAELAIGIDRGPLQGIPIGVKDIVAMVEGPTTAQSLVLDPEWGAGRDATVVERLKSAGAVITGKLSTMEFAGGMPDPEKPFPQIRNPWDTATWPGGSSSGSGAGVAAGLLLAAVATDSAGSIRFPAALCGVTGLMPTFGRVPNTGSVPLGYSLDRIGPIARTARDCGAFLQVVAGPDPHDPCSVVDRPVPDYLGSANDSLEGLRIGVDRSVLGPGDDPAMAESFEAAIAELAALGAVPVEVTLPLYAEVETALWVTLLCEAGAYHRNDLAERAADYGRPAHEFFSLGALFSGVDYVQAQRVRRLAQRDLAELFATVDLLATPTVRRAAPTFASLEEEGMAGISGSSCAPYWSALGNPALALPIGPAESGLPLSLQLAARPFEEELLVRAGVRFQDATDWHLRQPPVALAGIETNPTRRNEER